MNQTESGKAILDGRRTFLSRLLALWSVVVAVPIGTTILRFITPIASQPSRVESIQAGLLTDIVPNSSKIIRFGKDPVILVHTQTGQYKAFFARCTHLGCIVQYRGEEVPHFSCNCHGSQFDINGKNVAGPAPRPLHSLRVSLRENAVIVSKV